jgi:hypothetical protein
MRSLSGVLARIDWQIASLNLSSIETMLGGEEWTHAQSSETTNTPLERLCLVLENGWTILAIRLKGNRRD